MSSEVDIHPCFTCTLPDCDETRRECGLKKAQAAHNNARLHGRMTDTIRLKYNIAYRELYSLERNQRRREKSS